MTMTLEYGKVGSYDWQEGVCCRPEGGAAMDDTMLTVKFIEVLIMQLLVFAGFAAILVVALWDFVESKARKSRRADGIAPKPAG
jgi:hypothetical protein